MEPTQRNYQHQQEEIVAWANQTFGPVTDRIAFARFMGEVNELKAALEHEDSDAIQEECADVLITLYRIAGPNLLDAVDRKMQINRKRVWVRNGDGTGYHDPLHAVSEVWKKVMNEL